MLAALPQPGCAHLHPSAPPVPRPPPLQPRWILDPRLGGFPFPLTLTASHMVLCSAATIALTGCGAVERPPPVDRGLFLRTVVPIGALFAAALWLGNTAYVYLSVSFVQMLKARPRARCACVRLARKAPWLGMQRGRCRGWLRAGSMPPAASPPLTPPLAPIIPQAVMPLAVYSVGCLIGTESPSLGMALNLLVVVTGVLIATAGGRGLSRRCAACLVC